MVLRNNLKIQNYSHLILSRDTWRQIFYFSSGDDLKRLTITCKAFKEIIDCDFFLSVKRWGEGNSYEHLIYSLINATGPVHVGSDAKTMIRAVLYASLFLDGKILIVLPVENYDETLSSIKSVNGMNEILLMPHTTKNPDCCKKTKEIIFSYVDYKIVLGDRHSKKLLDIFEYSPPDIIFAMNEKCLSQIVFRRKEGMRTFFASLSSKNVATNIYHRDKLLETEEYYINEDFETLKRILISENYSRVGCGKDNRIYINALFGTYKCEIHLMKENSIPSLTKIGKENVIVFRSIEFPKINYPFKEWVEINHETSELKSIIDNARKIVILWTPEIAKSSFYGKLPLFQHKKRVFLLKDDFELLLKLRYSFIDGTVSQYMNSFIPDMKLITKLSKDRMKFLRKNRKRCFNDFEFMTLVLDPQCIKGSLDWISKFNLFINCEC